MGGFVERRAAEMRKLGARDAVAGLLIQLALVDGYTWGDRQTGRRVKIVIRELRRYLDVRAMSPEDVLNLFVRVRGLGVQRYSVSLSGWPAQNAR